MGKADLSSAYRNNRTICLPISQEEYDAIIDDPKKFRKCVDARFERFSELFPSEITNGYRMKDFYFSQKLSIWIRRIHCEKCQGRWFERCLSGIKDDAQCIKPDYAPDTVNIDGWKPTHNVWTLLFSSAVIIYCFLHVFIKIRKRGKKKHKDIFETISDKLWNCYYADTKRSFAQRIRRFIEWCKNNDAPATLLDPVKKLKENISGYSSAYDFPESQRTSNMIDRLMQRMNRHLFTTQYFHGSFQAAGGKYGDVMFLCFFLKQFNHASSHAMHLSSFFVA
jgi:hypothetical protein